MIKLKKNDTQKDTYLIIAHVFFGVIATFFPVSVPIVITIVTFLYLIKYSSGDKNKLQTLMFIGYLTGMELLYRVAGISFLPYELSKYIQISFIVAHLLITRTWFNSPVGLILVILLMPSLILYPAPEYKYFVFNTLGIISLGFFIAFIAYQKITFADFVRILKSFLLPCISFVIFITIKTPDFSDIEFGLSANFETSGGFGTNQLATLLGAAICVILIMLDKKFYIKNRVITLSLMVYFFLRALLSFSRGGILGLILSVALSSVFFKKIKQTTIIAVGAMVILFSIVFIITNNITGGALLLRYEGETAGTIAGTRDKDASVILSGRGKYATTDLNLFFDNIFFGVGPGNSQFSRYKYGLYDETAPHTEATRLLGENGIFGFFVNLILIIWPIYIITRKTPDVDVKYVKCMLFTFAYATTYHSAMRTGITPLFYGLASMNIYFPKEYLMGQGKQVL